MAHFKCKHCNFLTHIEQVLIKHVRNAHDLGLNRAPQRRKSTTLAKDQLCSFCGYATAYKPNLTKHVRAMHLMIKDKVCDKCDFATSYSNLLTDHKKEVHCGIDRPVKGYNGQCPHCNFLSSDNRLLIGHMKKSHREVLVNRCDQCDYVGITKKLLRTHKLRIHLPAAGEEKCKTCDFSSQSRNRMTRHQKTAHGKVLKQGVVDG